MPPSPDPSPPSPGSADHRARVGAERRQRTRDRLIDAALVVVTERGLSGRLIDDVIETAGVARGTFYNHFRTPDELLRAVAAAVGDAMLEAVDPSVRVLDDPALRVATGVRGVLRLAQTYPRLALFLARVGPSALGADSLAVAAVARDLADGVERGRFAPLPPRLGVDLVVGPVFAAFHALTAGALPSGYVDEMTAAVLRSLGLPGDDARRLAAHAPQPLVLPPEALFARVERHAQTREG